MPKPGELFVDRFELERLAGEGGMGSVYRARDRRTGAQVAVKFLHGSAQAHRHRFLREADILAELQHPAVVRYVAHGTSPEGQLYLAMEWLEGQDLGERLRTVGVTPAESVHVVDVVAEVLELAHGHGVIHRDIKPSNLFLVDGDPARVKVLDFGVARLTGRPDLAGGTRTGSMLGTPGYMAPEQARGLRDVDGRADLFSLGCVLFQCLTGAAPFAAEHDVAVLAKILLDDPPKLSSQRPELGSALESLVDSLLSKQPSGRPASAAALRAQLRAIGPVRSTTAVVGPQRRQVSALTGGERRLFSVVLAGKAEVLSGSGVTQKPSHERLTEVVTGDDATFVGGPSEPTGSARLQRIHASIEALGGALASLGEDTFVVSLSGEGVATDQAARAARCALALRAQLPEVPMAVATGRGEAAGRFPVGEVIDRAAALLRDPVPIECVAPGRPLPVHLDALTANLLGARFEWSAAGHGGWLKGESAQHGSARTLLGRPTPCVGRERELSRLLGTLEESVEERVARPVLVTAAAGMGKSRLRDELLGALPERFPDLEVWSARADPMRAGSPFHLLSQLIAHAAGFGADDDARMRQQKLRARVKACMAQSERERVAMFLGELSGAPFDDVQDLALRAARRDAQLMGDQTRRAFEDWLAAEVAEHPLLLVLDDLHWGDLPTVSLLDAVLRHLRTQPLTVLALARPAVNTLFPKLWEERDLEVLRLRELPRRAAMQLVRAALGAGVDEARVEALVAQAEGNPFFLEELCRAEVEAGSGGHPGGLPDTVLAMVQARLEALEPFSRRVLRAASIFGRTFWQGGVATLCGGADPVEVAAVLGDLTEREVLERLDPVHFAGEETFTFRQALLHDAASAMLTDADRALGHRLAAAWLLEKGELDALAVAEHLFLGSDAASAVEQYARAAADALRANDLHAAVSRAEKAVACGAVGEQLGALRLLQAEAYLWLGEQDRALGCAETAMALLPKGGEAWCRAAIEAATGWGRRGDQANLAELGRAVLTAGDDPPDPLAFVCTASRMAWPLFVTGLAGDGHALLDAADRVAQTLTQSDPSLRAATHYGGATRAMLAGDLEDWIWHESGSVHAYEALGDLRRACESRGSLGFALLSLGAYPEALEVLQASRDEAARLGLTTPRATALQNLGHAYAALGEFEVARANVCEALAIFEQTGNQRMFAGSQVYLARIDLARGEPALAEAEATRGLDGLVDRPALAASALATRAVIRMTQGELPAARGDARQAAEILERLGEVEEDEAFIRRVDAETAWRVGDRAHATSALRAALDRLAVQAGRIADPRRRAAFEHIAEHQRIRALAQAWGVS